MALAAIPELAMRGFVCFVVLVLLALLVGLWDDFAFRIAGFKPFGPVRAEDIDEPTELDDREAPRFLAERNEIEIRVPRDMSAGEFLRLYQLGEFVHVRRQIAKKEGIPELRDDHRLRKGRVYRITLTPPSEEVP
jgi:hypothetical protein